MMNNINNRTKQAIDSKKHGNMYSYVWKKCEIASIKNKIFMGRGGTFKCHKNN